MNKMQFSVDRSNSRGFHRGRRQIQFNSTRGNNRPFNHQGNQRQFGNAGSSFCNHRGPVVTDIVQFSVEIVVTGHIQSQCLFKPVPQLGTYVPFATIPKH